MNSFTIIVEAQDLEKAKKHYKSNGEDGSVMQCCPVYHAIKRNYPDFNYISMGWKRAFIENKIYNCAEASEITFNFPDLRDKLLSILPKELTFTLHSLS